MKRYLLYNPLAANGRGEENVKGFAAGFDAETVVFINMTEIKRYGDVFDGITDEDEVYVIGGDGTLNRFINDTDGDVLPKKLYFVSYGSGNDFVRDIGGEAGKPVELAKYIKDLPYVYVKGMKRRFINGIGFGIDGYCCEEGDRLRALSDKPINYTAIAIKGLLYKFHPANAKVTVDGVTKEYKKVWLAPAMNGRYFGGGMMAAPGQDRLGDGTVTLMVAYGRGKLPTLIMFPTIFKGKHVESSMVEVFTGRNIEVEFDRPTPLQIDGETVSDVTSYRVEAVKVPAEAK